MFYIHFHFQERIAPDTHTDTYNSSDALVGDQLSERTTHTHTMHVRWIQLEDCAFVATLCTGRPCRGLLGRRRSPLLYPLLPSPAQTGSHMHKLRPFSFLFFSKNLQKSSCPFIEGAAKAGSKMQTEKTNKICTNKSLS